MRTVYKSLSISLKWGHEYNSFLLIFLLIIFPMGISKTQNFSWDKEHKAEIHQGLEVFRKESWIVEQMLGLSSKSWYSLAPKVVSRLSWYTSTSTKVYRKLRVGQTISNSIKVLSRHSVFIYRRFLIRFHVNLRIIMCFNVLLCSK